MFERITKYAASKKTKSKEALTFEEFNCLYDILMKRLFFHLLGTLDAFFLSEWVYYLLCVIKDVSFGWKIHQKCLSDQNPIEIHQRELKILLLLFISFTQKICNFIETQKSNLTVCIKYEDCKAFLIINKPITGWNTNISKNNTDHCVNDAKKKLCERMDSRKYMSKWNQIPNSILTRIHYTTMNQCKPKTKQ